MSKPTCLVCGHPVPLRDNLAIYLPGERKVIHNEWVPEFNKSCFAEASRTGLNLEGFVVVRYVDGKFRKETGE